MADNLREIDGNVTANMQVIEHDGPLIVNGNVESGSTILATHDIHIKGEVNNAKVKSLKGNVVVDQGVRGVNTIIQSGMGDVFTKLIYNSTIKAENNVHIKQMAIDAHVIAKKCVYAEGRDGLIEGGEVEAGQDIVAYVVGSDKTTTTILKISDFKQRELYAQLLKYKKEEERLMREIANLDKFIEVIRILGNKVLTLPNEKKQDLAMKVKKHNAFKEELAILRSQSNNISIEHKKTDELERTVIVRGQIYTGVVVFMDKSKLQVQQKYKNVILYKRGIIIVGDYDKFMHRKKYAY